jgi:hypothetical protein
MLYDLAALVIRYPTILKTFKVPEILVQQHNRRSHIRRGHTSKNISPSLHQQQHITVDFFPVASRFYGLRLSYGWPDAIIHHKYNSQAKYI